MKETRLICVAYQREIYLFLAIKESKNNYLKCRMLVKHNPCMISSLSSSE